MATVDVTPPTNTKPIATPKKGKAISVTYQASSLKPKAYKRRIGAPMVSPGATIGNRSLVVTVTGVPTGSRKDVLNNIRRGLSFSSIGHLETAYRVSQKEIAKALSIPNTTLNRRKTEGRLHPDESDRVVRLARLKDAALALMNFDDSAAVTWLLTPLDILGGESPLDHSTTELGARDVEDLIGRLRHGVFS